MTALLRYLSGYVCVELTGYATERFLNLCTNHDINLWNMDHKEDTYTFCMSLEDFRKIRPMVRKTRTKIRISACFPVSLSPVNTCILCYFPI